jgi:hypothetical protein
MRLRPTAPSWGSLSTFFAMMCAGVLLASSAVAQPKKKGKPVKTAEKAKPDKPAPAPTPAPVTADPPAAKPDGKKPKEQNFNFNDLNLNGRSRSPQLLYFLERANEELERASLEKRSFIPHLVRTVEDEAL